MISDQLWHIMGFFTGVQMFLVICGVVFNVLFATTIVLRRLQSNLTITLLIIQSVCDGMVCLIALLMLLLPAFRKSTKNVAIDFILCNFWTTQYFFWVFVEASVQNLVCTGADRFLAVMRPSIYRLKQRRFIISMILYTVIISIVFPVTRVWEISWSNDTCQNLGHDDALPFDKFLAAYSIIWSASVYFCPTIYFFIVYIKIIITLRRSIVPTESNISDTKCKFANNLTTSILIVTIVFMATFSMDSVMYILDGWRIREYDYGSSLQKIGVFLITLNSVINPLIYFCFMKKFRLTLYSIFTSRCKGNHTEIVINGT